MNALELRHVNKRYGDFAIQDLNLALPQGCVLGLVGENGAGKTTTIRMLLGMIPPDSGEMEVLGAPVGRDFAQVRAEIGVVLDEPGFPAPLSAGHIGKIMSWTYPRWDADAYRGYLKRFDIPEAKAVKDYSRGMKMKLSIAVALSHDARLLLLDEATSGLDPVARDEILDIFFEFTRREDRSILMSSHIVSDLEKLCDYVAFLHRGQLMISEEKDLLLERFGLFHGSREQLEAIPAEAVWGRKQTPYGVEALVEQEKTPGLALSRLSLEELFLYMTKEVRR